MMLVEFPTTILPPFGGIPFKLIGAPPPIDPCGVSIARINAVSVIDGVLLAFTTPTPPPPLSRRFEDDVNAAALISRIKFNADTFFR